jgi:hypothetical protein
VLAAGTGALIARLARVDLPGLLPLGLAGTIVLVQPFTASDATAELGVAVAVAARRAASSPGHGDVSARSVPGPGGARRRPRRPCCA